jgi:extracellular factor (EF) 3-hydroxypalmitic acid methyl ester biosynthesis protein
MVNPRSAVATATFGPRALLERAVKDFARLESLDLAVDANAYHQVATQMHALCGAILAAEASAVTRANIQAAVAPARALHGLSPFVRRLQTWPRGYPGDFETIEYLCDAVVRAPRDSIGYFIEYCCLRGVSAQQYRNKVAWQAQMILETALRERRAKILSIACGGSPDVRSVQALLGGTGCKLFLNDMDADALCYSLDRLPALRSTIRPLLGDVFNAARKIRAITPLNLILAGDLFDYLSDRQIVWLLPRLIAALGPGGRLCFTNITSGNPDRVWLEYLAGWHLIERSESDIRRLIDASALPAGSSVQITSDLTGLTSLVQITT